MTYQQPCVYIYILYFKFLVVKEIFTTTVLLQVVNWVMWRLLKTQIAHLHVMYPRAAHWNGWFIMTKEKIFL